ncbi:Uncharacterised protein [Mycobacteroides abscessus subsp. massiliense]|nr:Uncharacterised protein [Mycobacteroides abscessus subsp. massiliense]
MIAAAQGEEGALAGVACQRRHVGRRPFGDVVAGCRCGTQDIDLGAQEPLAGPCVAFHEALGCQ